MIDDCRLRLKLAHRPIGKRKLLPNGREAGRSRVKLKGMGERSLRVRSVKNGQYLIIEGSLIGYLLGHNVIGSMNLQGLVQPAIRKLLRQLGITPSKAELKAIREGRIDLERLDVVGYLKVGHLGGPGRIVKMLDIGLAGSKRRRAVYPGESIIYNMGSEWWSLTAYFKAKQMMKQYGETWAALDPAVQDIASNYLRFELRQLKPELESRGWHQVRDVDADELKEVFAQRMAELRDDLRSPFPTLPTEVDKPSRALLLGLLKAKGVDLITGLDERAQQRTWKELREQHGVDRRNVADMPARYVKTLSALFDSPSFPPRHGAPTVLRKCGLVKVR